MPPARPPSPRPRQALPHLAAALAAQQGLEVGGADAAAAVGVHGGKGAVHQHLPLARLLELRGVEEMEGKGQHESQPKRADRQPLPLARLLELQAGAAGVQLVEQ